MHKSVGKQRYAYSTVEEEGSCSENPGTCISLLYVAQAIDAGSASGEITERHHSLHSCCL